MAGVPFIRERIVCFPPAHHVAATTHSVALMSGQALIPLQRHQHKAGQKGHMLENALVEMQLSYNMKLF